MNFKLIPAVLFSLLAVSSTATNAATAREQAAQAGIRTCLPVIEKVEAYLIGQQTADAVTFWDNVAVDKNMFSALIELEGPRSNSIASLNVTPTSDGQCVAEYSQTGFVPQTCMDYLKTLGNGVRYVRDLGKKSSLFQGQGVQILLTNAGTSGCVWVRKEVIKLPQAGLPQPASTSTKPSQTKRSTR